MEKRSSSISPSRGKQIVDPTIKQIFIDTGNLLRSEEVKRQATLLPDEEAIAGFNLTVKAWKKHRRREEKSKIIGQNVLLIKEPNLCDKVDANSRENIKITIKLFIYQEICQLLEEALDCLLSNMDTNYLDSLIIALSTSEINLNMESIKRIWKCAEQIGAKNKVKDFGMSDLDTNQLIELFNSAQSIKPSSNQINLESCCVIPPEMKEFAQNNNIKLLTHNDSKDFLTLDKFKQVLSSCGVVNVDDWSRHWVARYTMIQKHKGIVHCKGYILSARKND